MNNGLPNLLDAIFGKKDLAAVSLDEIYEVINEFPSFNAAHLLLSKKLKQENGVVFEKENMRTALYFNNPFWLQTLLDQGNLKQPEEPSSEFYEQHAFFENRIVPDVFIDEENDLDDEVQEILEEKNESERDMKESGSAEDETNTQTVTSFEELMSKYKIEEPEPAAETAPETMVEEVYEKTEQMVHIVHAEQVPEQKEEIIQEVRAEPIADQKAMPDPETAAYPNSIESGSEILNEYGIFEDTTFKEQDIDLEAFDRPFDPEPVFHPHLPVEVASAENDSITEIHLPDTASETEAGSIVENQQREDEPVKEVERDYEAFDRPVVQQTVQPEEGFITREDGFELSTLAADNTEMHSTDLGMDAENQMPDLVSRFEEKQKSATAFDAKKAEAIVFAPYHMIDYFASQGIKLILEDQPADSFGKQLKSFTDWLKVMKKLPVQPLSEKTDEKEADRIRHFAAHSIEERDILTESMAEVLAKQGMYENAIALYQKLSLIYPPKSAYFASRIEQLKASLP